MATAPDGNATAPEVLGSKDAVVVTDDGRMGAEAQAWWVSLFTFHRAPCLRESVLTGVMGGGSLGVLRFLHSRDPRTAFVFGYTVTGILSATNWFVCRRAMYENIKEESNVLNRAVQGDAEAIKQYSKLVKDREQKKSAGE